MKVYFAHGKESGPWGFKIKRLGAIATELGCAIESIDYTDLMDAELRVQRLVSVLNNEAGSSVLVGSSMGGYVSLVASATVNAKALFLMAPALYIAGFKQQDYASNCAHIEIVHGWSDEVIPVDHSIRFARKSESSLHLISGDHGLNASIETVGILFRQFLTTASSIA